MKIQKVSENQIKFFLTSEDLKEREIKITELTYGSEKVQIFFREIMEEAMIDCGFDVGSTPLMIEAVSIAMDTVMIIVSKVLKDDDVSNTISLSPKSLEERKFKQEGIKIVDYRLNEENEEDECIYIYSFGNLDTVMQISARLSGEYNGKNTLYKYEDKYFLLIQKNLSFKDNLDFILSEYGQKHISNVISKYHLMEHGEIIIKNNALEVLSKI